MKGEESTKCESLARASCFRAVFGLSNIANVAVAALKSTFFDNSIVFQRPLGIQKVLHNACFVRPHRVSGLFLKGTRSTKCAILTRASRFRPVFGMPNSANVTIARCRVCISVARVRFLREMRGQHRHIEQLTD